MKFHSVFEATLLLSWTAVAIAIDTNPTPIPIRRKEIENMTVYDYRLLGMSHTLKKYTLYSDIVPPLHPLRPEESELDSWPQSSQSLFQKSELDSWPQSSQSLFQKRSESDSGSYMEKAIASLLNTIKDSLNYSSDMSSSPTEKEVKAPIEKLQAAKSQTMQPNALPSVRPDAELYNSNNCLFLAPVTLGNGQVFDVDLDTGSSDTWFRGPQCESQDNSCNGDVANLEDPNIKSLDATFLTSYGSGAVAGHVISAPVTIGGKTATLPVGISRKQIGFNEGITDGLMGLAYNPISQISKATGMNANFMDWLAYTNKQKNMVSFYLSKDNNRKGEVTFGGMDSSKFTGPIHFMPLNSKTFWQVDFEKATFEIGDIQGSFKAPDVIADTGTSLIILRDDVARTINEALGATIFDGNTFSFPDCRKATLGPDVIFNIQGKQFAIPASIYVLKGIEPGSCTSGFTSGADGKAILGDTFLRAYYSIYDKDNAQLGFAKSIDNDSKLG